MSDYTWPVTVDGEHHVITVDVEPEGKRATIRVDGRIPVKPMSATETERAVPIGTSPYLVRRLEDGTFDLDMAPPDVFTGEQAPGPEGIGTPPRATPAPEKSGPRVGLWIVVIIVIVGAVFGRAGWRRFQYMRVPWTPYSAADASFKVKFPGVPHEETETRDLGGDRWSMTTLSSGYRDHFYGLEYVDVNRVVTAVSAQPLIEDYFTRWAGLLKASVVSQEATTVSGNPAIRFVVAIPESADGKNPIATIARGVVAIRNKRVFFVWAVAPESHKSMPDLGAYVASFELPPPPATTLKL